MYHRIYPSVRSRRPDSWFFFQSLQLHSSFLNAEVSQWFAIESYKSSLANVKALNATNDCAERGVKLSSDFLASAKGERRYQNIMQVVEIDRKKLPNVRRKSSV